MKYYLTPLAKEDLRDIVRFIRRDRPQAARNVSRRLRETCRLIAGHPDIGERRLADDIRTFSSERWVVAYRLLNNCVQVVRVVDGARDTCSLLS